MRMTTNSSRTNIENLDFREEDASLAEVEAMISGVVDANRREAERLEGESREMSAVDYDDADRLKHMRHEAKSCRKKQAEYEAYVSSPYFCHFEASMDGGEVASFYVGEKSIRCGSKLLVIDWRSPLGGTYRNKTQRKFRVNQDGAATHLYELKMRRMVSVEGGQLRGVNTEYDSAAEGLEGEVVDPFLRSVLLDKRRNYKLSDIIRSIQENQNAIMELPVDASFIVQGCAGSGKTMIMLHRLSYLSYNNPRIDLSKYLVLMPSDFFDGQIEDLCNQLGLDATSRMTVEAFYLAAGRRLSRNDVRATHGRGPAVPKVQFDMSGFSVEDHLPDGFLTTVYSEGFAASLVESLESRKCQAWEKMRRFGVDSLLGLAYDPSTPPHNLAIAVVRAARRLRDSIPGALERAEAARGRFERAKANLDRALGALDACHSTLDPLATVVRDTLPSGLDALTLQVVEARESIELSRRQAEDARVALTCEEGDSEEAGYVYTALESEMRRIERETVDVDKLVDDPGVRERAERSVGSLGLLVESLREELNKARIFEFAKKRALREEIEGAESKYREEFDRALREGASALAAELSLTRDVNLRAARDRLEEAAAARETKAAKVRSTRELLDRVRGAIASQQKELGKLERTIDAARAVVAVFDGERLPNLSKLEDIEVACRWSGAVAEYRRAFDGLGAVATTWLQGSESRVDILRNEAETAREDCEAAELEARAEGRSEVLRLADEAAAELDCDVFLDAFYGPVRSLEAMYGVEGGSYRYGLYLKALFCSIYYGSLRGSYSCVCVDEAQDLSPAEHMLLRRLVGAGVPFNLYGDVNQRVSPYRGLSSWTELDHVLPFSLHRLNENYRNSLQITRYCNEHLKMDVVPVGLEGAEVGLSSLPEAVEALFQARSQAERARCAVIFKRGLPGVRAALGPLLGRDASWGIVDASKVSVIPVEAAKGLEFDCVVVICNGMSENESYIAMTRALETLVMTSVAKVAAGQVDDMPTVQEVREATIRETDPGSARAESPVGAGSAMTADSEAVRGIGGSGSPIAEEDPFFDIEF